MNAYAAYSIAALAGAAGSVLVALVAIRHFTNLTDSGMWAIAAMVMTPSAMTVAVSYFINRSHSRPEEAPRTERSRERDEGYFRP